MYSIEKGTKTESVMTSCKIFSCGSDSSRYPSRFAGTWSRYSNSAMPQLANAAMYQGFELKFFRCPYHAKVMKTFDRHNRIVVWTTTGMSRSSSGGFQG